MFSKVEKVNFVTDTNKQNLIKSIERMRRGNSTKILLKSPQTLIPSDWYHFLSNDENKIQLMQFILDKWLSSKYCSNLESRRVMFAIEKTVIC